MGQGQSQIQGQIPDAHMRIYQNLLSMKSPGQKSQMIQTILASPEHLSTAKSLGIYGHLLHYTQVVQSGGTPPKLPGEGGSSQNNKVATSSSSSSSNVLSQRTNSSSTAITTSNQGNEKAMNYFSACLRVLELEEEVALTEESLKGAYKKAVVRAHPDKGGSEKEFEAVTRAYAYLGEIIRRIHGGRAKEGKMDTPNNLAGSRATEADQWSHVQPVALNPNKMDMNAFNLMFEQTRIPDPEEQGYGDWLKGGDDNLETTPKFSGKFNREVFHKAFEDEQKAKAGRGNQNGGVMVVQEMSLASRLGFATELGRGAKDDYTIAPHEGKMAYTDLKKAYTQYNTISHEVSGINIENRSYDQVSKERKGAVAPLTDHEMEALQRAENAMKKAEEQRKLRMAQELIQEQDYFERMKRLVIRN